MAIKKPNDTDTTGNYVTHQMSKKFDKEASQY